MVFFKVIPISRWAKNRVKEHGDVMEFVKAGNPPACGGRTAHFMKAFDGWFGWFTLNDADFEEVKREPDQEQWG